MAESYRVGREPIMLPGDHIAEQASIATPHGTVQVALIFAGCSHGGERAAVLEDLAEALNHARQLRQDREQEKEAARVGMHAWLAQMPLEYLAMLVEEMRERLALGPDRPASE